ncbi:MAG TPA: RNase A-like domain-containing protein [Terriglobales bacterium]|nr:RNase A-like domain-containing protein [Terriglobales bacterium]
MKCLWNVANERCLPPRQTARQSLAHRSVVPTFVSCLVVLTLVLGLFGCERQDDNRKGEIRVEFSTNVQEPSQQPRRLLQLDELRGGHTLKRHVGLSDSELRQRLRRERISAASTYSDQPTAEVAVGAALEQNRERINRWMARTTGHPNLVLDYDSDHTLGRTLHRGENKAEPCSHALVILKWDGPGRYYVLTSYPECR